MMKVRNKPYNSNGYNQANALACLAKGCTNDDVCLRDDFGGIELKDKTTANDMHSQCAEDYLGYVRHRVEDLFPVRELETACGAKSRAPTGKICPNEFF